MSQRIPIYIPTYINSAEYTPARVLPRLFFFNGTLECEQYYIQDASGSTRAQNAFPYFDNYNVVTGSFPTTGSASLLFNNEVASYGTIPNQNLYTQYWETYVNLLYNPYTRLMNASAIIPLADYFQMQLNDIVNFRGNYFHLRAINDYSVKTGECTVQLLGPIIPDALPIPKVYAIGEFALGGIVTYIDGGKQVGEHGFVTAISDQTSSVWGCKGTNITSLTSNGKSNTSEILNQCVTRPIAASSTQVTINGYSDWYLPSSSELFLMWLNIGRGASGANFNIGNFTNAIYWSSNEALGGGSANQVGGILFNGSGNLQFVDKDFSLNVRAVRRF